MDIGDTISHSVTWASLAATTFMVVFKGLPKFLEIYTAAQESLRKSLSHRVDSLEKTLKDERADCERKLQVLWDRIEKMRLIIVRRVAANPANGRQLEGQFKHSFGDPFLDDMNELLRELEVPFDSTDAIHGPGIAQGEKTTSPAAASEAKQPPKV